MKTLPVSDKKRDEVQRMKKPIFIVLAVFFWLITIGTIVGEVGRSSLGFWLTVTDGRLLSSLIASSFVPLLLSIGTTYKAYQLLKQEQ
jgi:hypothetical protein